MPRRKRSVKNTVHKLETTVKFGRKDFGGKFKTVDNQMMNRLGMDSNEGEDGSWQWRTGGSA
jgi:hypothetical protein